MTGALLGVLVGAMVFVGCQSSPEPPPLETESPSPSATPSTSPTEDAPTLPPEAKGADEAAAKAFVRYYVDLLNYAGPAGETAQLREFSAPNCAACGAIADFIDDVSANEGEIRGDGWDIQRLSMVNHDKSSRVVVIDAVVRVHPQRVRANPQDDVEVFPGGQRLKTFWLKSTRAGWRIERIDQPS